MIERVVGLVGLVDLFPLPRANCRTATLLRQFTRWGRIEPTNPTKPTSHAGLGFRRVLKPIATRAEADPLDRADWVLVRPVRVAGEVGFPWLGHGRRR